MGWDSGHSTEVLMHRTVPPVFFVMSRISVSPLRSGSSAFSLRLGVVVGGGSPPPVSANSGGDLRQESSGYKEFPIGNSL